MESRSYRERHRLRLGHCKGPSALGQDGNDHRGAPRSKARWEGISSHDDQIVNDVAGGTRQIITDSTQAERAGTYERMTRIGICWLLRGRKLPANLSILSMAALERKSIQQVLCENKERMDVCMLMSVLSL